MVNDASNKYVKLTPLWTNSNDPKSNSSVSSSYSSRTFARRRESARTWTTTTPSCTSPTGTRGRRPASRSDIRPRPARSPSARTSPDRSRPTSRYPGYRTSTLTRTTVYPIYRSLTSWKLVTKLNNSKMVSLVDVECSDENVSELGVIFNRKDESLVWKAKAVVEIKNMFNNANRT